MQNDSLEHVIVDLSLVVLEARVEDGRGDFGSISELRWQSADFTADAQDLLGEQPAKKTNKSVELRHPFTISQTCVCLLNAIKETQKG